MVLPPRLPGLLPTWWIPQHCDSASERCRIEERLPRDALEEIMGCLDHRSLRTARLVSKTFCAAASARVCSLTLASTSQAVSFHRYPRLRHLTVTHSYESRLDEEGDSLAQRYPCLRSLATALRIGHKDYFMNLPRLNSLAQLDPCLRDLATALTIGHKDCRASTLRIGQKEYTASVAQTRDFLSQAALMPKLRKLEVMGGVEHEAALLARCTNLEALVFDKCSISVARAVVTMTRLTALDLGSVHEDEGWGISAESSWLGQATNLRSLQALSISIFSEGLALIGNLTGLTGLTVFVDAEGPTHSIAPLTRLTRLKFLCIGSELTESNLRIACSLGSGSLANLELWPCDEAPADCGRYLSRQTALTRLTLGGRQLCNLRHMGGLRLDLLQRLELHDLDVRDAAGLSGLCRATSLTKLHIGVDITHPQFSLSQALAQLTQLRSLSLTSYGSSEDAKKFPVYLSRALSPLTALTELAVSGGALGDQDLRALLILPGLRMLQLEDCCLPDEVLQELGALTELSSLKVRGWGVASLVTVSEALEPLRKARGLPPLYTR